jgi:mannan endo-1,4-beta-mannosidase
VRQTTSDYTDQRGSRLKATKVRTYIGLVTWTTIVLVAAVLVALTLPSAPTGSAGSHSTGAIRYLGLYEPGAPGSYTGIDQFAKAIGRQPNIALYYGSWLGKFQVGFAAQAAERGATTLVQMGTGNTSLSSIASGQYDSYWRSYADEVKAFGRPVILSLDHEMNGDWYPIGYKHTSPVTFKAAWRHVVTIFREQGARNVTWLWTINIIDTQDNHVANPAPWWPGSSYVNWVGIDGYYYVPSETFAPLFGPTITKVRELTDDPILIAETGTALSAGQATKIADIFAGVSNFGLLGFVLFDQNGTPSGVQTWRINSSAVYAALRQGIKTYMKP